MSGQTKIRVPLAKAYIGYTVAENVWKEKEIKLLGKDIVLSQRMFELLKTHEIKYIYVYEQAWG